MVSYLVFFIIYFYFYDYLYQFITLPIQGQAYGVLISQDIIDPLVIPVTLSSHLSLLTVLPVFLFQLLSFVRPALYQKEKVVIDITGVLAVVLFYVGAALSFFLVEPLLIHFVQSWLPPGIMFLPTIRSFIDFSLDLAIAFGVAFEVPVILMIAVMLGWVSVDWVRSRRSWWVVGLFFFAMVLTPPDVYSQVVLALPMWALIELVLIVGKQLKRDTSD
jgi:sec-independent protein translocase protein TatC